MYAYLMNNHLIIESIKIYKNIRCYLYNIRSCKDTWVNTTYVAQNTRSVGVVARSTRVSSIEGRRGRMIGGGRGMDQLRNSRAGRRE